MFFLQNKHISIGVRRLSIVGPIWPHDREPTNTDREPTNTDARALPSCTRAVPVCTRALPLCTGEDKWLCWRGASSLACKSVSLELESWRQRVWVGTHMTPSILPTWKIYDFPCWGIWVVLGSAMNQGGPGSLEAGHQAESSKDFGLMTSWRKPVL